MSPERERRQYRPVARPVDRPEDVDEQGAEDRRPDVSHEGAERKPEEFYVWKNEGGAHLSDD